MEANQTGSIHLLCRHSSPTGKVVPDWIPALLPMETADAEGRAVMRHLCGVCVCVHTSAQVSAHVCYLISMSLGFSIYKMGVISNSNLTERMGGLNEMMQVTCLTENKAQKIKTLNSNCYYYHSSWKLLRVLHIDFRHYISNMQWTVEDTKYNICSLISICLPRSEGKEFTS